MINSKDHRVYLKDRAQYKKLCPRFSVMNSLKMDKIIIEVKMMFKLYLKMWTTVWVLVQIH